MKKLDPPKLSARGEPPKFSGRGEPPKDMNKTPNPSDFMDLLDLENPVIKNDNSDTSNPINKQTNLTNVKIDYAVEETKKEDNLGQNNNNAFNFDFNSVSKQRDTPKKEIDQIDILFG